MEKMSTSAGLGWFFGGVGWFILWTALAIWAPWSSKVTPSETAQTFFSKAQYQILYPPLGKPTFDPNNPNPAFKVTDPQKALLTKWGFNDCVAVDGTAAQSANLPKDLFVSGCFCENAPAVKSGV